MGIRRLKSLLSEVCEFGIHHFPDVKTFLESEMNRLYEYKCRTITNPIEKIRTKTEIMQRPYRVAIDAHLYLLKYKRNFKVPEYGFLRQIIQSLSFGIIPIYVFDGISPESKSHTIDQRKNKTKKLKKKLNKLLTETSGKTISTENDLEIARLTKKTINITKYDIINIKNFLDILNIPHITASGEADDLITVLYNTNIIDACQSDDMDMLPKGCKNLIQISNTGVTQYILDDILKSVKLTHAEFVDMCILMGSDYFKTYLPRMKAIDLYKTFQKNPSIESFVSFYEKIDIKIADHIESYRSVRKFFDIKDIIDPKSIYFYNKSIVFPRIEIIEAYFIESYGHFTIPYVHTIRSTIRQINNRSLIIK